MTHRHPITRRTLMRGAAATAAFGLTPALARNAGNWPDHAVRMVIPYPAGGSTDVLFRILAERLKDKIGQSFVTRTSLAPPATSASTRSRRARLMATPSAAPRSGISRSTSS